MSDKPAAWREYEERKTIESKIVKDADWLDVDLEIREQKAAGRKHMEAWDHNRGLVEKLLYTKSGKKMWRRIQTSDPSDWYRHARNRYVEGDLKRMLDRKNNKGKL